ncbi:DUF4369 domain-containing protein, partial [candidate division KSB1 bacterium]|nr:DUF4369 domain-containing protein [candidate division KSB1 bacterium]
MLTLRIALVCIGFAASGTFAATLCGNIAGSTDGQITLVQRQGNRIVRLDSTRLINGNFCLEHIERRPPGFYGVRIESIPAELQLILDRRDVVLQSHNAFLEDSLIFSDDQNNAYQKLLRQERRRGNRIFLAQQLHNLYTGDTSARGFIISLQNEMARLKQEQRQSFTALAGEMAGTL